MDGVGLGLDVDLSGNGEYGPRNMASKLNIGDGGEITGLGIFYFQSNLRGESIKTPGLVGVLTEKKWNPSAILDLLGDVLYVAYNTR